MIRDLNKGDSETLEFQAGGEDITNWKIRFELFDSSRYVRLANSASGGGIDQIEITDALTGKFLVKIPKDSTINFDDLAQAEVEIETPSGEKHTWYQEECIKMLDTRIGWTNPDD